MYTFYNYIDIRYSEAQSRILTKRLFRRGPDVEPISPGEMNHFDGTEDEIRSYSDDKKNPLFGQFLVHCGRKASLYILTG